MIITPSAETEQKSLSMWVSVIEKPWQILERQRQPPNGILAYNEFAILM